MSMCPSPPLLPLDPTIAFKHVALVSDEACFLAGDKGTDVSLSSLHVHLHSDCVCRITGTESVPPYL